MIADMRLGPLDDTDRAAADLARTIVTSRAAALGRIQVADDDGALQGPFACLPYSPVLGDALQQVGTELRRSTQLSPAVTEAVILTVATHWRADYEWYAHADPAVGNGALTTGDLNRIAARERGLADPAADVASALVRELLDTTDVSDRTWAEAAALFGDRAAVEIVVLAGYYSSLAMLIRGFRTPLPPEASTPEAWPPYPSQ